MTPHVFVLLKRAVALGFSPVPDDPQECGPSPRLARPDTVGADASVQSISAVLLYPGRDQAAPLTPLALTGFELSFHGFSFTIFVDSPTPLKM